MPNQFLSDEFGDLEEYFVTDYRLIDQYVGDQLWSWGLGTSGQLGVNDTTTRSTPVTTILGGTNWKFVANGGTHTLAIKTDGTLWIWGRNDDGQLGVNDNVDRSTPVTTILGGTNWNYVSVDSNFFSGAIKTDGSLWVWGSNYAGRLGVNDFIYRSTPVTTILGGTNWKYLSFGGTQNTEYIAAIKTDGTLWTWGDNGNGKLGVNDTTDRFTPVTTILGGNNWKFVETDLNHMTAVTVGLTVDFS